MASITRERITAEEFAKLPETNLPTELINGEIIRMPSPSVLHQKFVRRFSRLLEQLVPNPDDVYLSPLDVNFD